MESLIINGPSHLKGKVKIQGAKNSAMKHVFIPLMSEGEFMIDNIPRIGSTENHISLIKYLGAKTKWLDKNKITIEPNGNANAKPIPKEYVYYTSGGNHNIPIMASKYGFCEIEIESQRKDYGGDRLEQEC